MPVFVSYLRALSDRQEHSSLGIGAQREVIDRYVAAASGAVMAEFIEVESGRRNDRPQLAAALAACRLQGCTLLIARPDRLVRNVSFLSGLMEAGVEFVAADMPSVTRFTIPILAAVAEEEARFASARTKAALAAVKARGVRLGNPNLLPGSAAGARAAAAAKSKQAQQRADDLVFVLTEIRAAGVVSYAGIARALTARGVPTLSGRGRWDPSTVRRLLASASAV